MPLLARVQRLRHRFDLHAGDRDEIADLVARRQDQIGPPERLRRPTVPGEKSALS